MIPEGTYPAVVTQVEGEDGAPRVRFGETKKGTQQCLVYFEITEGKYTGTVRPWFGFFTKDTYQRTLQALRYCGFKGNDIAKINEQPLDQAVQIVIVHDEYDGKVRDKIAWVNSSRGAIRLAKTMDRGELQQFAARLAQTLSAIPEEAGPRVTREPSAQPPHVADDGGFDEIPF